MLSLIVMGWPSSSRNSNSSAFAAPSCAGRVPASAQQADHAGPERQHGQPGGEVVPEGASVGLGRGGRGRGGRGSGLRRRDGRRGVRVRRGRRGGGRRGRRGGGVGRGRCRRGGMGRGRRGVARGSGTGGGQLHAVDAIHLGQRQRQVAVACADFEGPRVAVDDCHVGIHGPVDQSDLRPAHGAGRQQDKSQQEAADAPVGSRHGR